MLGAARGWVWLEPRFASAEAWPSEWGEGECVCVGVCVWVCVCGLCAHLKVHVRS